MLLIVILVLAVPGNSQRPCTTKYTARLNSNSSAGRLQICWSEESARLKWHSVCSSSSSMLNDDATAAVCRQFDFNCAGSRGTFGVGLHSSF